MNSASLPSFHVFGRAGMVLTAVSPTAQRYWIVGNKSGLVFAGLAGDYVPDTDQTYQDWLAAGGQPTTIPTDGELADVLTNYGLGAIMSPMAVRNAGWTDWGYVPLDNQAAVLIKAGMTLSSTGSPDLNAIYPIDNDTRTRINTNVDYINRHRAFAPDEASSKVWIDVTGTIRTFTDTDDFLNFATAVANYYAGIADWAAAGGTGDLPSEPVVIP